MSRVLVTGGAGYIGSHAVLALREAGRRPVVLDDLSTGSRALVPSDVPFVLGNAGDPTLVGRVIAEHDIDSVIHFAASIAVEESVRKPLDYWRNNVGVTRNLVEACVRTGVGRFVFSSTAAVYGDAGERPLVEAAPTRPVNPYGRSKLACEWLIGDAARVFALRAVLLRYFNVAGADPQGRSGQCGSESTHLIRLACETALGRRPVLSIFGADYPTPDGTGVRDFVHVSDVAQAHVAALDYLERDGATVTLNLGYGRGLSVRQVIAAIEAVAGRALPVREEPRRAGDCAQVVADARLIREVLGWAPAHDDVALILRTALDWEAKRPR